MRLSILECTADAPHVPQGYPACVSSAEVEKPWVTLCCPLNGDDTELPAPVVPLAGTYLARAVCPALCWGAYRLEDSLLEFKIELILSLRLWQRGT